MVNHPNRSVMDRLQAHPRVQTVDDERSVGNGVIVTLKQGWTWDRLQDNRVAGENTPSKALAAVQQAHAFDGPFTP